MAARRRAIEEDLEPLAGEVAESLGLEVYDLVLRTSGPRWKLTVYLENPSGSVTLDDCTRFSRQFSRELDVLDPIPRAYDLEVSSPGLERTLARPRHFERALGTRVSVRWRGEDGRVRNVTGVLAEYEDGHLGIEAGDAGERVRVPLAALLVARTVVDW